MPFDKGQSGNPATQFPPGNNANPEGRPVGTKNRGSELRKLLALPITYKDATGKQVEGDYEGMITMAIVAAASNGDVNAFKAIMDDVYGKLTDKSEITLPAKTVIKIGGKRPKPDAAPAADH